MNWYQSKSGIWYNNKTPTIMYIQSTCDECGSQFFERKHKAKGKKGGSGKHFCSRACASKSTVRNQDLSHLIPHRFVKGQTPINFKGGCLRKDGYRKVGNVLEHRLVMGNFLGRPLERSEIIHHVNGDKADNRIENLEVMSQAEHITLHLHQ